MRNHLNSVDGYHSRNWFFINSFYLLFHGIASGVKIMTKVEIDTILWYDTGTELVVDKTKNFVVALYIKQY